MTPEPLRYDYNYDYDEIFLFYPTTPTPRVSNGSYGDSVQSNPHCHNTFSQDSCQKNPPPPLVSLLLGLAPLGEERSRVGENKSCQGDHVAYMER